MKFPWSMRYSVVAPRILQGLCGVVSLAAKRRICNPRNLGSIPRRRPKPWRDRALASPRALKAMNVCRAFCGFDSRSLRSAKSRRTHSSSCFQLSKLAVCMLLAKMCFLKTTSFKTSIIYCNRLLRTWSSQLMLNWYVNLFLSLNIRRSLGTLIG